jgi:transposase
MAAPLSQDLRKRLVDEVEQDSSARQAAARFAVSASVAIKLVRRVRETGSTEPRQDRRASQAAAGWPREPAARADGTRKGITPAEIRMH